MIKYLTGNIFDSDTEAIVNTVNCVGVMGRGIALQFKKRFPENFSSYESACKNKQVVPGKMFVHKQQSMINPKYIVNFPTKRHWREKAHLQDITLGLSDLKNVISTYGIKSIAIPPLGCGLGGLDWNDVKRAIESALGDLTDVEIVLFEPGHAPAAETMAKDITPPEMTPGRAALIELIKRYLQGLLDPFITLLEVHKLMYFLQECGQPLRLGFQRETYGPYATNLRHVLKRIEGYYLQGYADGGDAPKKPLELLPNAAEIAEQFLANDKATSDRIDHVCNLVDGFESPFGLELLATVHWLVSKENKTSLDEIVKGTYEWNEHKKQFSPRQIAIAASRLQSCGWIDVSGV